MVQAAFLRTENQPVSLDCFAVQRRDGGVGDADGGEAAGLN